jgi:uncharacterized protein YcaQ
MPFPLPPPERTLERAHARRFLLHHQQLLPPRQLTGRDGILEYVRHVGCIQYDPLNVVGRNPDLVLQSRIAQYDPQWLEDLMHVEHRLLVGWDKMAAVILREAWPHFRRHRELMTDQHGGKDEPAMKIADFVLEEIRKRGPLCSRDIEHEEKLEWWWGREARLVRAALEVLSATGAILTHHRVRSVRYFDLAERVLPPEILNASDPHPRDEDYEDWHVTRRIGSLGLAPVSGATDYWYGIVGVKGVPGRTKVLARLAGRGEVVPLAVEGIDRRLFFLRTTDLPGLEASAEPAAAPDEAAFLAPLDNAIWNREMLRQLFDFDYRWEVYTPKAKRIYGYYVLPVLYGERFIARAEPILDKKTRVLTIAGWWWEKGVRPNAAMRNALSTCIKEFARYLSAKEIRLGDGLSTDRHLPRVMDLAARGLR